MKGFFTKFYSLILVILATAQISFAQVYIWGGPGNASSEFAGGLNDWTTNDDRGCVWYWTANGKGTDGSYYGTQPAINSPTVSNGAAIFNSDKFHSKDGIAYPHRGELTSPAFSCENNSTVFVSFYQRTRIWNPANEMALHVSADGGNTWVAFDLNLDIREIKYNVVGDSRKTHQLIDISAVAANKPQVQIRFVWNGSYYYWILDDVYVMEQPEVEMEVFAAYNAQPYQVIPASQIDGEPFEFAVGVINKGATEATGLTAKADIYYYNTTAAAWDLVHSVESPLEGTLASGDTSDWLVFAEPFVPTAEIFTAPGSYAIEYVLTDNGEFNTRDNTWWLPFNVSQSKFDGGDANDLFHVRGWGGSEDWNIFNVFTTGSWANSPSGYFAADSTGAAAWDGTDNGEDFITDVNAFLYKVSPDVAADFSNFDTLALAQFDFFDEAHPQLEMVGFGFESGLQSGDFDFWKVPFYNLDFDAGVRLEPNTRYLLMYHWNIGRTVYHGTDDAPTNYKLNNGIYVNNGNEWQWFFGLPYGIYIGMDVLFIPGDGTNTPQLPESVMDIFPNPVNTIMNINIDLGKDMGDATLVLTDMNNKVIETKLMNDLNATSTSMNVSNVPAGNYILRLVTEEGIATKKVMIQR